MDAGLSGSLSLAAFILSVAVLTGALRLDGALDTLLFFYPLLVALVCVAGYVLSALNVLSQPGAWALAGVLSCVLSHIAFLLARYGFTDAWS